MRVEGFFQQQPVVSRPRIRLFRELSPEDDPLPEGNDLFPERHLPNPPENDRRIGFIQEKEYIPACHGFSPPCRTQICLSEKTPCFQKEQRDFFRNLPTNQRADLLLYDIHRFR